MATARENQRGERGNVAGTHGDDEGTLGEVGDGPEPANLTKMAGGSEVEDDGDGGDAGLSGSIDIAGAVRSILTVTRYQRSPTQRVLVPVKSNLAAAGPALLFELSDHVEWLRQLDEDAESLLNGCDSLTEAPTKQQQVEEELPRLLEKGPVSNQEIIQHFKNKGIQDRTVNLVKGRLNIRSVRKGDKWYWQLNA